MYSAGMKKTLIACTAAALLGVGCGTKTIVVEKAPDTTPEKTVPATAAPVKSDPTTDFLNGMTYSFPSEVASLGKAKVLELGRLTCGAIDEGSTLEDFALLAVRNDVDGGFIGALIREAVHNFCPENQWFIDSALNGV